MSLSKQAKILSKPQIEAVLGYLATTRHPERNRVIFFLSARAGLRAKEINLSDFRAALALVTGWNQFISADGGRG